MNEQSIYILAVEDEEEHAELIRRAFANYPTDPDRFHLTVAGSLEEARSYLATLPEESRPDLIIADLLLPDGRGIELLPTKQESASFPMVVMTSYGNEKVAVEAIKAGALDYVVKSVETLTNMPHIAERALREWKHITERKRAEDALRESEHRLKTILNTVQAGIIIIDIETGRILDANPAALRMVETTREAIIGHICNQSICPVDKNHCPICNLGERVVNTEGILLKADGEELPVIRTAAPVMLGNRECVIESFIDISERKNLEEQLRQAQKMEAIGRLAGGVAHDFNNILTAILGYTSLLLNSIESADQERKDLNEIKKAAERAASLTQQLLAFSRKQILQPEVLNLNSIVTRLNKMLRRLIGEDIQLITALTPDLGRVKADPGQLEQVIMNLVVNARDAMLQGGKLTIETKNVIINEAYTRQHVGIQVGTYVMLAISDTGVGMDKETLGRIFEPFFTTKEQGKGTGLGLATVHGIVKQSGGHLWVYSEPRGGTTFKIYLPQVEKDKKPISEQQTPAEKFLGTETVLVVEDEPSVRVLVRNILKTNGYTVLEAQDGDKALLLSQDYPNPIELLITDVVMPGGLSGPDLAKKLTLLRSEMKTLYVSGYTDSTIVHHGMLSSDVAFLQKPFSPDDLARKVREVLDAPQ